MIALPNPFNLLVAGLGNIGSHFMAELAQSSLPVRRADLVDPEIYEESNLGSQAIEASDVGKPKVDAQAAKLLRARPEIRIGTHEMPLEAVPFGVFREADIIVSGLDSRRARALLNERVFRTGVARWIDAGVSPDAGLARITVLFGGDEGPCLECEWSEADYAAMEQRHLCGGGIETPSTDSSAELGRLATTGLMTALESILAGGDVVPIPRETLLRLDRGDDLKTKLTRHVDCRFHHVRDRVPDSMLKIALDQSLGFFFERVAPQADAGLSVEGTGLWVRQIGCPTCGAAPVRCVRLSHRFGGPVCARCGAANLVPIGFESQPILWRDDLGTERLAESLWSIGIRSGDEITFYRGRRQPEPILRLAVVNP